MPPTPSRHRFAAFFSVMELLLRPERGRAVTLGVYKRELVRTLLPMAPYLQGL